MKRTLLSLSFGCLAALGAGQVMFSGGTYTQDFDSLVNTGTNIPWTDNATIVGWHMRRVDDINGVLADQYNAGDGSSNTGAVYSFGTVGTGERALGSVASGSVEHAVYGLQLRNTSANNILEFTLAFTGEQWRNGGNTTQHSLMFSYRVGGTDIGQDQQPSGGVAGYVADPSFTRVTALDFIGPIATSTAAALNGNDPANQAAVSATVTLNAAWTPGTDLWIRWVDLNDVGNDHGLAIDNLNFQATPIPEPATLAALAIGAAGLLARRRRR
jgi:uncharacterized protein